VGLPVFSTLASDRKKLLAALRTSLRMAMFLFVPCMAGIALVAEPLVNLLYGPRWIPAAPVLSILALSTALWPIHVLNLAAIGAQGKSNLLLRVEVVKQSASIGLIIVCAPWGPTAIAWAVLCSSILSVFINTHYCRKLLGYGAIAQVVDQFATFVLSSVAAIAGWAVLHWTSFGPLTMLSAIAASAAVYLLLAALTGNTALRGLVSIVRTLRAKPGVAER
jgi:O-antigen/teichoic acid export membrane protein